MKKLPLVSLVSLETEKTLWDSSMPYDLRRPKGSTEHAPRRFFQKAKPRYKSVAGVLVMNRRARRGAKGPLCPVVSFGKR